MLSRPNLDRLMVGLIAFVVGRIIFGQWFSQMSLLLVGFSLIYFSEIFDQSLIQFNEYLFRAIFMIIWMYVCYLLDEITKSIDAAMTEIVVTAIFAPFLWFMT